MRWCPKADREHAITMPERRYDSLYVSRDEVASVNVKVIDNDGKWR
jgi:capsular polysaccharide biosynthesis protein